MQKAITAVLIATMVMLGIASTASAQLSMPVLIETFLNQDPDPAEPGKYLELRWKVEKQGNAELKDIQYYLHVTYPFSFDPIDTPERNLGNWEGFSDEDEFATLHYKVLVDEDALEGTYEVGLRSKTGTEDTWVMYYYDVRVGDKERPDFIVGQLSTSPAKLASDVDEAEISVELANIGDGDAENVIAELLLPSGFTPSFSYSDRQALGTVAAGSSKTAMFYADIDKDISGGVHEAELRISYKEGDDNEMKTKTLKLDLPLKDKPNFEISKVTTAPEAIQAGSTVDVRIEVVNTGGDDAESVSVRAFKDSSQPLDFIEKSDFIGKLKPGESGEAILRIEFDSDAAPKRYTIDLEVRAVDDEEVIIQDRSMTLEVNGTAAGDGATGAIVGGLSSMELAAFLVAIVVVGAGAYYAGKGKGSKQKK